MVAIMHRHYGGLRTGADHRRMIGGRVDCHGCVREHVRVTYDAGVPDIIALHSGLDRVRRHDSTG
jgi:hypothetical protein